MDFQSVLFLEKYARARSPCYEFITTSPRKAPAASRRQKDAVFIPSLSSSSTDDGASPPMDSDMLEDMNNGLTPVPNEFRRAFEFLIDAAQWDEAKTT